MFKRVFGPASDKPDGSLRIFARCRERGVDWDRGDLDRRLKPYASIRSDALYGAPSDRPVLIGPIGSHRPSGLRRHLLRLLAQAPRIVEPPPPSYGFIQVAQRLGAPRRLGLEFAAIGRGLIIEAAAVFRDGHEIPFPPGSQAEPVSREMGWVGVGRSERSAPVRTS